MAARLVVEVTRTSLRLALGEGSGPRPRTRAIRSEPLGTAAENAEILRGFLKATRAANAQVVGVISREQVITRLVKFPSTQPLELAQMTELYAKAQLPYTRDQLVIDSSMVSQAEGFSVVAIIACPREVVDRQLVLLRDAGLSVSVLTVSSWGVLAWYQQVARASAIQEPVLVVNVDDTRTDLVVIAGAHLLATRSIGQGAQDWAASQDSVDLLSAEVERSRTATRKELPGTEVRSLLFTGLGALVEWKDGISQRVGLPVAVIDGQQPFGASALTLAKPTSPVVAGGLACADLRGVLNLSPSEVRTQLRHTQQVRELRLVSALLLSVLGLGSGLLALQTSRQRHVALQLNHALTQIGPSAKQLQEKSRSAQLVSAIRQDQRRLATMLSDVFRTTPETIALEGLTFERMRRELVLRGHAPTTQDVLGYLKQLERLSQVERVDLRYSTRRSGPSGERTDFEVILRQRREAQVMG